MKENELRIGNIVRFEDDFLHMGSYGVIKTINENYSTVVSITECNKGTKQDELFIDLEGIELDEEWLLKFGFEKRENVFSITIKIKNPEFPEAKEQSLVFEIDFTKWLSGSYGLHDYKNNHVLIRYVHQLQNLYFALTGTELTIK